MNIPSNTFDWPERAVLLLRYGIATHKPYSQIAEQLSAEFKQTITTDAVASKANRDLRKETSHEKVLQDNN